MGIFPRYLCEVFFEAKKRQHGQILLIVVLTMVVALTIGLSVASRTISELRLSKQNEESQRAFQAAEAGIERTLENQGSIATAVDLANQSSYTTSFATASGTTILLNNGLPVDQSIGADVWLSSYPDYSNPIGGGAPYTVNIYWGTSDQSSCGKGGGAATYPGLEIAVLEGGVSNNVLNPTFTKAIYEYSSCNGRIGGTVTKGTSGTYTVQNQVFTNRVTLSPSITNGYIMKIMPIFNSGVIAVESSSPAFPAQGAVIESTGTSGQTVRKVVYYRSFPQMPLEVFPYTILSQ